LAEHPTKQNTKTDTEEDSGQGNQSD